MHPNLVGLLSNTLTEWVIREGRQKALSTVGRKPIKAIKSACSAARIA